METSKENAAVETPDIDDRLMGSKYLHPTFGTMPCPPFCATSEFDLLRREAWEQADEGVGFCIGAIDGTYMGNLKKQLLTGLALEQQEIFRAIEIMHSQMMYRLQMYTAAKVYQFACNQQVKGHSE